MQILMFQEHPNLVFYMTINEISDTLGFPNASFFGIKKTEKNAIRGVMYSTNFLF